MTDYTTHYGLPFPEGKDAVAVNADLEELAKRADVEMQKDYAVQQGQLQEHERKMRSLDEGQRDVFRVRDKSGQVAFKVDEQGRTHIYSPADGTSILGITTLHVFVAAGQSNMSGRGLPVEGPQSPRIMQFGANRRVIEQAPLQLDMVDSPAGTSPATFFAHNYLATQPSDVGVLLVPAARGGTTFTGSPSNPASTWTWVKDASADPEHALYNRSVEQTLAAIVAAEDAGYHPILKGVLWHQGEGNGSTATEVYAGWLDDLIRNYRDDLEAPDLPVLVGQMAPEGIDLSTNRQRIDKVHRETPQRVPYTGFAPATYGGHNPGDTTHFSTFGTSHLGNTFATAYLQAVGNHRPGPQIALDTSVGTRVYVGNTMIHGDTGSRNVTDSVDLGVGWFGDTLNATVQRTNNTVTVVVNAIRYEGTETGHITVFSLPTGFRPNASVYGNLTLRGRAAQVRNAQNVAIQDPSNLLDYFYLTFLTNDPWPTTLPGTPA